MVKLGRIAGQFAKPRSAPTEVQNGKELPSYRGDIINGIEFTEEARVPDPQRMLMAYRQSAATLKSPRACPRRWHRQSRSRASVDCRFRQGQPSRTSLSGACRAHRRELALHARLRPYAGANAESFGMTSLYTSHEALMLGYEQGDDPALNSTSGDWYATSGHFLWVGDRRHHEAHIEFLRGIKNRVGERGRSLSPDDLLRLIDELNPANEFGLAHAHLPLRRRQGGQASARSDPRRRARRQDRGADDPMHGNYQKGGLAATRRGPSTSSCARWRPSSTSIAARARMPAAFMWTTGKTVTQCVGSKAVTETDLSDRYHSHCDPEAQCRSVARSCLHRFREGPSASARVGRSPRSRSRRANR